MHLAHLRLRDFRNYARLDLDFQPGFHLFLGDNAQGKTNILEAIYLVATLRSFRGVGSAQMVRHAHKGYFVGARVVSQGEHEVKLYWSPAERSLTLDGNHIRRLSDYFGVLRTVVFCSEDLLLVKGPGRNRRRFMDLLLAQTQPGYLPLLQRYTKALKARNAILKQAWVDPGSLESFSRELVQAGDQIVQLRRELVPQFAPAVIGAYQRVTSGAEEATLTYAPSIKKDFALELSAAQERERALRSTLVGPHRDELHMQLNGRSAAQFGSEGQKRTLAIALKMAQAEFVTAAHGTPPVLLIDDIMGELDAKRRAGFLPLLRRAYQGNGQVFMTATEENWPEELRGHTQRWHVKNGTLQPGQLLA